MILRQFTALACIASAAACSPSTQTQDQDLVTSDTPTAQCMKDTDCKGDRICENEICTAPTKEPSFISTSQATDTAVPTADAFSAATKEPTSLTEFLDGERTTYTSIGNPKAKGIEVSFDYPSSWRGAEGKRPNTLYQTRSENGKGLEICNLGVKEIPLPAGYAITSQDLSDIFDPQGLRDFVPTGSRLIAGAKTTIEGQPAAWINFSQELERAGIQLQTIWVMYPIYIDRKFIFFNCSVGDSANKPIEELQSRYNDYRPLFQQMANSIVIHSKWRHRP